MGAFDEYRSLTKSSDLRGGGAILPLSRDNEIDAAMSGDKDVVWQEAKNIAPNNKPIHEILEREMFIKN